ncbi:hypothetical protein OQA88_8445 [Cercophora sp. LCS_1]
MIQIVDQSADAFDTAEKKMRAIRTQTNVMFGRNGLVQTILMCLQDPRLAKKSLLNSMSKFEKDTEKCAAWAQEIESQFSDVVKCAGEVNLAMAEGLTIAAEEQEDIKLHAIKAEIVKERQENVVEVIKSRVNDAQSEFVEAREQFQKTSNKGEASAMFAAAAVGIGSAFTGLVGGVVNVFQETPKVAVEALRAAGHFGAIGIHHHHGDAATPTPAATNGDGAVATGARAAADVGGLDPALLSAEQIETQLLSLNELLDGELPDPVREGGSEIKAIVTRLEAIQKSLRGFQSKHTVDAGAIMDEALGATADILSLEPRAAEHCAPSPRPNRARASGVPAPSARPHRRTTRHYDKILHQRHQTLLIKRSAMNEARTNLERQTERRLQAQADIIEIDCRMRELAHEETAYEDTKKVLRKAIDVAVAMQDQVRQLTGFFNALASIIAIICVGQAETYLSTIEAGLNPSAEERVLLAAHSERQLQIIRETVVSLRGHFGFVVHSADMYQDIATRHINPCIRMAANLPLSAGPAEQDEARRRLKLMTDESSEAIRRLAQQEMEAHQRDLESRVLEIEGEMAALEFEPPPEELEEVRQAIRERVEEPSKEMEEEVEGLGGLFEEIMDDL